MIKRPNADNQKRQLVFSWKTIRAVRYTWYYAYVFGACVWMNRGQSYISEMCINIFFSINVKNPDTMRLRKCSFIKLSYGSEFIDLINTTVRTTAVQRSVIAWEILRWTVSFYLWFAFANIFWYTRSWTTMQPGIFGFAIVKKINNGKKILFF